MSFKRFIEENIFGDDFEAERKRWRELIRKRGKIIKRTPVEENYILKCYRGFPKEGLERDAQIHGNAITLDPKYMKDNLIWFTHNLQQMINPIEYAQSMAYGDGYLLTYHLKTKKHYDIVQYENGEEEEKEPQQFENKIDPTNLSPYLLSFTYVYELPKGWYFTWKTEKFIGCETQLKITKDMLQEIKT